MVNVPSKTPPLAAAMQTKLAQAAQSPASKGKSATSFGPAVKVSISSAARAAAGTSKAAAAKMSLDNVLDRLEKRLGQLNSPKATAAQRAEKQKLIGELEAGLVKMPSLAGDAAAIARDFKSLMSKKAEILAKIGKGTPDAGQRAALDGINTAVNNLLGLPAPNEPGGRSLSSDEERKLTAVFEKIAKIAGGKSINSAQELQIERLMEEVDKIGAALWKGVEPSEGEDVTDLYADILDELTDGELTLEDLSDKGFKALVSLVEAGVLPDGMDRRDLTDQEKTWLKELEGEFATLLDGDSELSETQMRQLDTIFSQIERIAEQAGDKPLTAAQNKQVEKLEQQIDKILGRQDQKSAGGLAADLAQALDSTQPNDQQKARLKRILEQLNGSASGKTRSTS